MRQTPRCPGERLPALFMLVKGAAVTHSASSPVKTGALRELREAFCMASELILRNKGKCTRLGLCPPPPGGDKPWEFAFPRTFGRPVGLRHAIFPRTARTGRRWESDNEMYKRRNLS